MCNESEHSAIKALRERAEGHRKQVEYYEEAVKFASAALEAIAPRARPYFTASMDRLHEGDRPGRYYGISCKVCDGLHASPTESDDAIIREHGHLRHAPGCAVAELEALIEETRKVALDPAGAGLPDGVWRFAILLSQTNSRVVEYWRVDKAVVLFARAKEAHVVLKRLGFRSSNDREPFHLIHHTMRTYECPSLPGTVAHVREVEAKESIVGKMTEWKEGGK